MMHFPPQIPVDTLVIQQCATLIPCHTLEDFPNFLDDGDARSLLAAWTTPWHPALIAATGRLPSWYRADSIPEPLTNHWLFLPSASVSKLPSSFFPTCEAASGCRVIRANSREEFLRQCRELLPTIPLGQAVEVHDETRIVTAQDFYALGYAWLQVQLMTRRLRYTSNLDEIFFTGRVVLAARSLLAGDGPATVTALHEAFDALAEERDHYFSTDPHLVDLTLLAPSTLGSSLAAALAQAQRANEPPVNVLIDCDLAPLIEQSSEPAAKSLRELIAAEVVGVAGGGIAQQHPIHHQTASSAQRIIADAKQPSTLGQRCHVYARTAGPTPGDLATTIADQGYIGAIPIDFAAGEGWSSESKLSWNSSSSRLDVLVSKPIDGSRSDSFLSLAVRLGQAIDGGEVATALIVHWPGAESDAYRDMRCAAAWGLALGRFWKIDDFFRDGQSPFHHYRGRADDGASHWLPLTVKSLTPAPLHNAATSYRTLVASEAAAAISTLADLVQPLARQQLTHKQVATTQQGITALDETPRSLAATNSTLDEAAEAFCQRLSATVAKSPAAGQTSGQSCLIINPHSSATRIAVRMNAPPMAHEAVYGTSIGVDGRCDVTVDVPAHGFVTLQPASSPLKKRWFSGRRRIAKESLLVNEFMQVEISGHSGGIKGVYSGSGRGNRYSLRLVHINDDAPSDDRVTEMKSSSSRVVRSDESLGMIETDGVLVNAASKEIADFTLRYSLSRGSRWLWVEAEIKPASSVLLSEHPWRSCFAFRSAIASEAATIFAPLRDKLHRTESKRFDSPAGLLIDESSRQTLLFTDGRPAHRQRDDRYLDSLLLVRDEPLRPMRFAIGFDVPTPIDALRSLLVPPAVLACDAPQSTPSAGWLVHCSTTEVVICDLQTESTAPLVISFLAIATRNESRKAKVRFCRNVVSAQRVSKEAIEFKDDAIEVALVGHEVLRIRVELVAN